MWRGKKAYRILSKWDMGQENVVYQTYDLAYKAVQNDIAIWYILEEGTEYSSISEMIADGVLTIKELIYVD